MILTSIFCTGQTRYGSILEDHAGFANPASLAKLEQFSAGMGAERRFMLNELNNYMAAVGCPLSSGSVGLKAGRFGFAGYNETKMGLAYGRKLGDHFDVGVQFNHHNISITGYGHASTISVELGTVLHLSDKLHSAIHIIDPVGGKFGIAHAEKLSSIYSVGLNYETSSRFSCGIDVVKEEDQPVNINAGFQYQFLPSLLIHGGVFGMSSVWLDIGMIIKTIRIDLLSTWHPPLGITPGLLLLFDLKKKEQ